METKSSLPCSQQSPTRCCPVTDQSSPRPRSYLILFSHLRLFLRSRLFPSDFPTKTLYTHLLSPIHATCPAHLILDMINLTIFCEQYRSRSSLSSMLNLPCAAIMSFESRGSIQGLTLQQTCSCYERPHCGRRTFVCLHCANSTNTICLNLRLEYSVCSHALPRHAHNLKACIQHQ